eukprot:PhM_4_TR5478/c0_g1_i1/m.17992
MDYLKRAAMCDPRVLRDPPVELSFDVYEEHLQSLVENDAPMSSIAPVLSQAMSQIPPPPPANVQDHYYADRNQQTRVNQRREMNVALKEAQVLSGIMAGYERAQRVEDERLAERQRIRKQAKEDAEAERSAASTTTGSYQHMPKLKKVNGAVVWETASTTPSLPDIRNTGSPSPAGDGKRDMGFFERVALEEQRRYQMDRAFSTGNGISRMYPAAASNLGNKTTKVKPTLRSQAVEQKLWDERKNRSDNVHRILEEEVAMQHERTLQDIDMRRKRQVELGVEIDKGGPPPPTKGSATATKAADVASSELVDSCGVPKSRVHPIDVLQRQIALALLEGGAGEQPDGAVGPNSSAPDDYEDAMYDLDANIASEISCWKNAY